MKASIPPLSVGLDVNTASTGFAIVTNKGELVECGRVDTREDDSVFGKAKSLVREMQRISTAEYANRAGRVDSLKWIVGVEDFLRGFGAPRVSLFALAQLNSLVCYESMRVFEDMQLYQIHPSLPRMHYKIKKTTEKVGRDEVNLKTKAKSDIKQIIFERVEPILREHYEFEYSRTTGLPKDTSYDVCDAYVIAQYAQAHHVLSTITSNEAIGKAFAEKLLADDYYKEKLEQHELQCMDECEEVLASKTEDQARKRRSYYEKRALLHHERFKEKTVTEKLHKMAQKHIQRCFDQSYVFAIPEPS